MNEPKIRTFIALKTHPQKHFLNIYTQIKSDLSHEKIRWVSPSNFHVTLLFLGQTKTSDIPIISTAIEATVQNISSFTTHIQGLGYFSNPKYSRVLFVKIQKHNNLLVLKDAINKVGTKFGIIPSSKNFTPHITLGRIKEMENNNRFTKVMHGYENSWFQKQLFSEIVFYKSTLTKTGAIYEPIFTYNLP